MAFFMISYDLRKKQEFDYEPLWKEFKSRKAVKCLESVYLLKASNTLLEIKNHFKKFIHEDDLLVLVEFTKEPEWTRALSGTKAWIDSHWP
ncbi:hypothetical protein thsrh120_08140 [Rhizobium sp. No.120]